ncbi:MAG: hypothetical protein IJ467_01795 [Bacteroidaceae bacterium]|nr:hypothetical protein [Bacteroidaceae bacterium]
MPDFSIICLSCSPVISLMWLPKIPACQYNQTSTCQYYIWGKRAIGFGGLYTALGMDEKPAS